MNLKEIYKDIPTFPNHRVSNMGKVLNKRLNRIVPHRKINKVHMVQLVNEYGKNIQISIAKLMLLAFIPNTNPVLFDIAIHIDGDRENLNIYNVKWGTRSICSRMSDKRLPEYVKDRTKRLRKNLKKKRVLNEDDKKKLSIQIKEYRERGYSFKQLTDIFPYSVETIRNILKT